MHSPGAPNIKGRQFDRPPRILTVATKSYLLFVPSMFGPGIGAFIGFGPGEGILKREGGQSGHGKGAALPLK